MQIAMDLAAPRRIDITLGRLDDIVSTMTEEQRSSLAGQPWWSCLEIASRLRSMEMGEEAVLGRKHSPLADDYDRLVTPGENPVEAILRTLKHHLAA